MPARQGEIVGSVALTAADCQNAALPLRDDINGIMQASEGVPDQSHGQVISRKNIMLPGLV